MFLSAQVHIYDALGSYMLNLTLFAGEEGEPITIAGVDWCESIPSAHARMHTHTLERTLASVCVCARAYGIYGARVHVLHARHALRYSSESLPDSVPSLALAFENGRVQVRRTRCDAEATGAAVVCV
jgi:hypothetical protein